MKKALLAENFDEFLSLLGDGGGDLNWTGRGEPVPLMYLAVKARAPETVLRALHAAGAEITPAVMHPAVLFGGIDVCRTLVDLGAPLLEETGPGEPNAIGWAKRIAKREEILELFLGAAGKPGQELRPSEQPRSWPRIKSAIENSRFPAALRLAEKLRPDELNWIGNAESYTLLTAAVLAGAKPEFLRALCRAGADPSGSPNEKYEGRAHHVPLVEAAGSSTYTATIQVEVCEVLLSAGASVNEITASGECALERAAMGGNARLAELLLKHGAEAVPKGVDHLPLEWAFQRSLRLARLLIEAGADPLDENNEGLTAIDAALRNLNVPGKQLFDVDLDIRAAALGAFQAAKDLAALDAIGPKNQERARKLVAKFERAAATQAVELRKWTTESAVDKKDWFGSLRRAMTDARGDRTRLGHFAEFVLSAPNVVQHPRWPDLVRHLIDQSQLYADVHEAVTGSRSDYDADPDSMLVEEWERGTYVTLDFVFRYVLGSPAAARDSNWGELMLATLAACDRFDFVPSDDIRAALAAGKGRDDIAAVRDAARRLARNRKVPENVLVD